MQSSRAIQVIGCHAEGEIGDVIVGGVLPPPGDTVFAQMKAFERDFDHIRRFLICEPRGSVARHVNLIVPPRRPDCVAGAIIMEPTEYPPMSGSNTICVTTVLLETGLVPMTEPVTRLRLDMPAGPVDVTARCERGKVLSVTLANVPSFALHLDAPLEVEGVGTIPVDVAYGGMIYALVDATRLGVEIAPHEARDLAVLGEKVRAAARAQIEAVHPENPEIGGVSIVQFNTPFTGPDEAARNTCIVSPGRSDRSPTGTGLSARLAVLHARGLLAVGDRFSHTSIIGSRFDGRILAETTCGGRPAIVPEITGRAWITGSHTYLLDPTDPYPEGYVVSDTWGTSTSLRQT
ncbi:proline racemase family protein [Chthonobacter rhizosphaerae]|uniref:proline racemase family protein n=1 Tax=Chthonobacter rhizosphaerae TaxID=2735553 RepID=UPI0015EE4A1E|nr:proline racemase family protein [Chthonobacter rhizosphaerae]